MDWQCVFDEAYPAAGATTDILTQFQVDVASPMSADEIETVNSSQHNPFPENDALHTALRPFNAADWVIPNCPLPATYLSLLKWSNGGEFRSGERWFQFFPANDAVHGVRAILLAYRIPQYMPNARPFAFDGGGTFYMFDMRNASNHGEYPIVYAHSCYLR